jgi:hypothetical protein
MTRSVPIADIVGLPQLLMQSIHAHVAARSPLKDFRLRATWKSGPSAGLQGPLLLSLTQYTPHRMTDLPDIWCIADSLGDELVRLDGAYGVVTYFQPSWRRVGSLSAWGDEEALAAFVALPSHREVMRKYRPRGLPLRSASWWIDELRVGAALVKGQELLDRDPGRRVVAESKSSV